MSTNSCTSPTPSVLIFPISRETRAPSSSLCIHTRSVKLPQRATKYLPLPKELLLSASRVLHAAEQVYL